MRSFNGIKPQDVLVMLKLIVMPGARQNELSQSLIVSQAEVSHGLRRLKQSRLLTVDGKAILEASSEFLIHGFKYICPPELGAMAVGIPTGYARPGFKFVRHSKADVYVWPHPEGKVRGMALKPFYASLPEAFLQDEELYSLASLIEMIRVGRAREQKIASEKLDDLIRKSS